MGSDERASAPQAVRLSGTRRALLRRATASVGLLVAGAAGCGRKGDLEPPPGRKDPDAKGAAG